MLLLQALLGREDDLPRNAIKHFGKLTSALEEIDKSFRGTSPTVDKIVEFIIVGGGISGLYDLSRLDSNDGSSNPKSESQKIVDLRPNEIALPVLGAKVTKYGREYRLRFLHREPGVYTIRIGKGGYVEGMLDESLSDDDAACA